MPPRVKLGLITKGSPNFSFTINALDISSTTSLSGHFKPISLIAFLNFCLSSANSIDAGFAPIIITLCLFRIPALLSSIDKLSAVCPPIVGSKASGFSNSIICSMKSLVNGSI